MCVFVRVSLFFFLSPTKRSTKRSEERKREIFLHYEDENMFDEYEIVCPSVVVFPLFFLGIENCFSVWISKGDGDRGSILELISLRDAWNWSKEHYLPIRSLMIFLYVVKIWLVKNIFSFFSFVYRFFFLLFFFGRVG